MQLLVLVRLHEDEHGRGPRNSGCRERVGKNSLNVVGVHFSLTVTKNVSPHPTITFSITLSKHIKQLMEHVREQLVMWFAGDNHVVDVLVGVQQVRRRRCLVLHDFV